MRAPRPTAVEEPASNYRGWIAVVLGVAVAARLVRWGLGFPLWGDEILIALNLLDMEGFGDVVKPLRLDQVAPPGFLAIELAVLRGFGTGERILRLIPLLAGLAALIGFRQLGRLVLRPFGREGALGALLSFAIFGVSYFVMRYCAELKPYSIDVLSATVALLLGARVVTAPTRSVARRWLAAFAFFAVLMPWFSYSSIFVIGAAGLTVFVATFRGKVPRLDVLAVGVLIVASFLGLYFGVMQPQDAASTDGGDWLRGFWAEAFPPDNPLGLPLWLLRTHTGTILAYPNGGEDGASTLTFLLVVVGAIALWRGPRPGSAPEIDGASPHSRRLVLLMLIMPFVLNLLAAFGRLYPYGGEPRLTLHLAPSVCLLAGLGAARLLRRIRTPARQRTAVAVALSLLMLLGIGSIVRDLSVPRRFDLPLETRALVRDLLREAGPEGDIVSINTREDLTEFNRVVYGWYLLTEGGTQLHWPDAGADPLQLGRPLLVVSYASEPGSRSEEAARAWREREGAALSSVPVREETIRLGKGHQATVLSYREDPAASPRQRD